MKKNYFKRVISLLLVSVMLVGLSACGKDTQGGSSAINSQEAKKGVYKTEDIDFGLTENDYISSIDVVGDRIYAITNSYNWSEDGSSESITKMVSQAFAGGDRKETILLQTARVAGEETKKEVSIGYTKIYSDGIYAIMETYYYGEVDAYGMNERSIELVNYDLDGTEKWRINLMPENLSPEDYFYINSLMLLKDNTVLVTSMKSMDVYNENGEKLSSLPTEALERASSPFQNRNGDLFCTKWDENYTKQSLLTIDITTGKVIKEEDYPSQLFNYSNMPSKYYDLLLSNNSGIYGYNMGDAEPKMLLNYINSDMSSNGFNQVIEINETQFMGIYYNSDYRMQVGIFTYVDPKDIPDKEIITVAAYYIDYDMRNRIIDYNKTNDKYRITVTDYSQYSTSDDYLAGYTRLNNDILAGNVPDIMALSEDLPVDSYIAKGLFADVYELIENDPELNREDYFENIFAAYSNNGKLYRIVPSFYVWTVMGKTSDVGTEPGWTLADLRALMATKPEGTTAFGDATRDSIMWNAFSMSSAQFINVETGKCNFNSEGFIELLEFIKEFPKEIRYEDDYDWMKYYTQYRDGSAVLSQTTLYSISDFVYTIHGTFGEPVTFIGFPTASGKGASICPNQQYAIAAKSKNKDGAWDFMRYYLTEEYQKSVYCMPVMKSVWKEQAAKTMERPYYEDENGEKVYYDYTRWMGMDEEIPLDPMSQEEIDAIYEYISSLDQVYFYNQSLMDIINDEAAAFFEGQKSAADVANIIQSRAQIYVNENR